MNKQVFLDLLVDGDIYTASNFMELLEDEEFTLNEILTIDADIVGNDYTVCHKSCSFSGTYYIDIKEDLVYFY